MGVVMNLIRVSPQEFEKIKNDSQLLVDKIESDESVDNGTYIDLDKAGIGIVASLAVDINRESLENFFNKKQLLYDEDDFEDAVYTTLEDVKELHKILSTISTEDFLVKFKTLVSFENNAEDPDLVNVGGAAYYAGYFEKLKRFYADAAKNEEVIITFLM